jgi:Uma2 family endonuclease
MSNTQAPLQTDTWVVASWGEYIRNVEVPAYEKAKGYYYSGQMRIEMSPVGPSHAHDNSLVDLLINLCCITKSIPVKSFSNCSYRKAGVRECQPDVSYYLGDRVQLAPHGRSVVDLNSSLPPDLAIEIASTTLSDDLGKKRLLYEEMSVTEYWVVDVEQAQIIAFQILPNHGSRRLAESQVLPELSIALLKSALTRSRQTDNTEVGNWFLAAIASS